METQTRRRSRIGERAKETGVSVRALRHYDERGLHPPTERTEAGYRLYSEDDVRRLYRLLALRRLGLTLEDIRDLLEDQARLEATLRRQRSDEGRSRGVQLEAEVGKIDHDLEASERLAAEAARAGNG
jgi:DNA-binding transcriptional MerR regulator